MGFVFSQFGVNLWVLWVMVPRASRLIMVTSKLKQPSHTAMAIAKELSMVAKMERDEGHRDYGHICISFS